jgi:NADPH:quinone reductase-like Zn-dependent oxidoreductase
LARPPRGGWPKTPQRSCWSISTARTYVSVPVAELAHTPVDLDHVQAAAARVSLPTAWQFMVAQGYDIPNPLQPCAGAARG